jgi:hypothetical protein
MHNPIHFAEPPLFGLKSIDQHSPAKISSDVAMTVGDW